MNDKKPSPESQQNAQSPSKPVADKKKPKEIGGFEDAGLKEPTRFGDWEVKGRCSDF